MTITLSRGPETSAKTHRSIPPDPTRTVDWRRLRSPLAAGALVCAAIAAVALTLGTVIMGWLAENPSSTLVWTLALCVVGGAAVDTAGKFAWVGLSDRAEGRLREDLLDAALRQPVAVLSEQAVGEILDRIDDDTHEVGTVVRMQLWMFFRAGFAVLPMWIVAGVTWWPAWLLFPLLAALTAMTMPPLLREIARLKVIEEMAWTDHASALEEGIAGRDDLRTSLGQAHVVTRLASLSAQVHRRFLDVVVVERALARRAGVLLHALLAVIVVGGVAMTAAGSVPVSGLVTLFLVTATFVGQISQMANHLPDLQEGLGAVMRLRQMLAVEPEPEGGAEVPGTGALDLRFRHLDFAYDEGTFALRDIDLTVPAGETTAFVGRTGSGKSTLASFVSQAIEPPPGSVLLGGVDVLDLDLQELRSSVGVVTQRTEILAGTFAENITLFAPVPREEVERAITELGLHDWVAGLPAGLDTLLGPGGTTLSSGEEQLIAFARLLVRDVRVVVLDEATARMDPVTERRVVAAADRLLRGRTGVLIAHRLSTIERAHHVAVLDHGRLVQHGTHAELSRQPGPFGDLLRASRTVHSAAIDASVADAVAGRPGVRGAEAGSAGAGPGDLPFVEDHERAAGSRRRGEPPERPAVGDGPSLARGTLNALLIKPTWGLLGASFFLVGSLIGAQGAFTGLVWGHMVEALQRGETPVLLTLVLVVCLLAMPLLLAEAFVIYPRWWIEVMLRTRMAVLHGQTDQARLPRTPPGEVVARSMDADRYARYADRWVDFVNGLLIAAITALLAGTWIAGAVLLAVMVTSALASVLGRPAAGRSAAQASTARASFGRALVSALESMRTVKLAAATPHVRRHLREVDTGRVSAAVSEHRIQAFLQGVPMVMVQCGVVAAWAIHVVGGWGLAVTLLVAGAVSGFDWFGRVAGMVVTEAPGTRAWQVETARFAGGVDLTRLPPGVDLVEGRAPSPPPVRRVPLEQLQLRGVTAVHDDGTIGAEAVDLTIESGELVLLVGRVGSGKSSLLSAMAGLIDHRGEVLWNGRVVDDPQVFLRPGQVSHIAQVPRVLSGTFGDNIRLGHPRPFAAPISDARLGSDVEEAGGHDALVGHRGVRLSGGQVQRLALARALATEAELLLADDVSSALDAATEIELWSALRERGTTVIGATSKQAALAQADRVVVLVHGRVAATGPWAELAPRWGHLAG